MKRVMWQRGQPYLLTWEECPTCQGMTRVPESFGCWDCRNGGRLPYWAPLGEWLLEHSRRFWVDVVEGLKSFYRLLD